jgi:ketosteroid isomerase-like protein
MKKIILLIVACFSFSAAIRAQTKEEKEVSVAVETLRKAMVDGDKAALEKITASELTYGHSSGLMEDQKAFVGALASGKSNFVKINLEDQSIQVVGNVGLVRHKLFGETNNGGKTAEVKLGVLLVWQKQQGQWKLLARQAFKL